MSKPTKGKPAKPLPHQLTAKAQGFAQPQEGGSFIRQPVTNELVRKPEAVAAPTPPAAATDTSLAGSTGTQQGN